MSHSLNDHNYFLNDLCFKLASLKCLRWMNSEPQRKVSLVHAFSPQHTHNTAPYLVGLRTWASPHPLLSLLHDHDTRHFLPVVSDCSGLKVPAVPAEDLGATFLGTELLFTHPPPPPICSAGGQGHTDGNVAGCLLGSDSDLQNEEDEAL